LLDNAAGGICAEFRQDSDFRFEFEPGGAGDFGAFYTAHAFDK
jgi:hypothetical protein